MKQAIGAADATRQLADPGARVITIERPGSGDFACGCNDRVRGLSSQFASTNGSRESLTLDLQHAQRAAMLHRLVRDKVDIGSLRARHGV